MLCDLCGCALTSLTVYRSDDYDRVALSGTDLHRAISLAAVRDATNSNKIASTRAGSIVPGRSFDVTAAPLPGGGAVAVLRDLTSTERVEMIRELL